MQINFMSQKWTVRPAVHKELVDCVGLCDPLTNTIILDRTLVPDVYMQTLMHELTHVVEMTLQLHLTEQQVDCIASGWLHMLRSNPELIKLIQQKALSRDELQP